MYRRRSGCSNRGGSVDLYREDIAYGAFFRILYKSQSVIIATKWTGTFVNESIVDLLG